MKVLLAEDDIVTRSAVEAMLTKNDHDVTCCANGQEAIETLEMDEFDVVITDLIMPQKDGIAVMDFIKQKELNIPVIAISAGSKDDPGDYLAFASYFADETIAKPIKKENLLTALDSLANGGTPQSLFWN